MTFNMIRGPRAVFGTLIGQVRRGVMTTGSRRLCSKPQEGVPAPNQAPGLGFKVPGYRPTEWDKKMLVWSGRFKTAEQIPEFASFEMIDAARNRLRVKACYVMMALTIVACLVMSVTGKRAASRNDNLTNRNMEKKARWREEAQKEKEAAIALAEKAQ
ncbi:protein FAM162B-like [Carassius auratus]|uniref:Protein FAM162B-like n=1 Tax=Carassius auratus TaxID=7957 RepID=A0A6P6MB56_CARAU|nr:protein FAM162B-like [Carassius auratus]XP_052398453.1 protein FAM162B [Carassius gibelio]